MAVKRFGAVFASEHVSGATIAANPATGTCSVIPSIDAPAGKPDRNGISRIREASDAVG